MLISDSPWLLPIPPDWQTKLRDWELSLHARGLRQATVDTRIRHLRRLARDLDAPTPSAVTPTMLTNWSGQQRWAPETRHAYHESIKLFYKWAESQWAISNPAEKTLHKIKRTTPPARPTPEQILHTAVETSPPRTELILRLAAELGLRRTEIALLHNNDLAQTAEGWVLEIHGKGGKTRYLPCPPELAHKIRTTGGPTWIFPGEINGHLSPRWISKLAAKQLPKPWSLHTLRHRFATIAYNHAGHDLIAVQQALGHTSIQTTQRYTAHQPQQLTHLTQATQITNDKEPPP